MFNDDFACQVIKHGNEIIQLGNRENADAIVFSMQVKQFQFNF